jgi:excisionase family DNA binding protein
MTEKAELTSVEASWRLGVGEETVREWVRIGKLRARRVARGRAGWRYLIPADEVERLLEERACVSRR